MAGTRDSRRAGSQRFVVGAQVGLSVMLVALIVFAVLVGILLGEAILTVGALRLVATAALMPLIGYGLGYALSLFFFRSDGP